MNPNWSGLTYVLPDLKQQPLTNLSSQDEQQFKQWITGLPWYSELTQMQGGQPPNLNDPNYDYRAAWKAGIVPERNASDQNRYHWSDYGGDKMMKSPNHPSAWAEHFINQFGINPDNLAPTDPRVVSYSNQWHEKYPPNVGGQGTAK